MRYIDLSEMKKVLDHFRKNDLKIYSLLLKHGVDTRARSKDFFGDLCETVIGQQLSVKAADTIYGRLLSLFPEKKITPKKLLKLEVGRIRKAGTSESKARYLLNIAREIEENSLDLNVLATLSEAQVRDRLIRIKGVGSWTIEMFLMFSLNFEDIFSFGDAGLRRAIKIQYNLKKDPTQKQMEKIVKKWSPYKTYASRALWSSL